MKIKKFNELKTAEAFFQLNFIDGFKYIDTAGEIMNWYVHKKEKIPPFQMNPSGLVIDNPTDEIESIRVSPTNIWMHFKSVPNLGYIEEKINIEADKLLEIIGVNNVQRLGLRYYLIYDNADIDKNLSIKSPIDNFNIYSFVTTGMLGKFNIRLEVNPVKKHVDDTSDSREGILFDVDIFTDDALTEDVSVTLKNIREEVQSENFIKLINMYLSK